MGNIEKYKTKEEIITLMNDSFKDVLFENIKLFDYFYTSRGVLQLINVIEKTNTFHDKEYKEIYGFFLDEDGEEHKTTFDQIKSYYIHIGSNKDSFIEESNKLANGEISSEDILTKFNDNSIPTNALMVNDERLLKERKNSLEIAQNYLNTRFERAKDIMEQRRSEFREISSQLKENISKLERIIFSIELYLGMNEELHQLKVGNYAKDDTKFSIRQRKLYMDEEVGDVEDGGLDMSSIDKFDEWLINKNSYWNCYNYEILVPEDKCIVAIDVRRKDKKYNDNPFINSMMNRENHKTYILIRNGENIYRLWSELNIGEDIFPSTDYLSELNDNLDGGGYRKKYSEEILERYKLNMLLFQGLIERSECFPYERNNGISIFKEKHLEHINFIYDNDTSKLLPSDMLSFEEFKNNKNIGTEEGSRIFWFGDYYVDQSGYKFIEDNRTLVFYRNEHSKPKSPSSNLYQLEYIKDAYNDKHLAFKYLPKSDYSWGEERKNKVSFKIHPTSSWDSKFYINYDNITREDIKTLEYYIHTRVDRKNYIDRIPLINEILKFKKQDIEKEDLFIKLSLNLAGLNPETDFNVGLEALEWWKLKNKWKRSLTTDDTKALRMIIKKLEKR